MNNHRSFRIGLVQFIFLSFLLAPAQPSIAADDVQPAISQKQIQQDWMIQQERRFPALTGHDSDPRPNISAAKITVDKGLRLAGNMKNLEAEVDGYQNELQAIAYRIGRFPENQSNAGALGLYYQARQQVRELAWQNPLLDFDSILFVKRQPGMLPHLSDQYYGWWCRPGGGICILKNWKSKQSEVQCLTEDWPEGNFLRPDLSYDGKKVLFAYSRYFPEVQKSQKVDKSALPEETFYHIFEMDLDSREAKQLTFGRYDDFDARYLPDGDIVFLSTRKGQFVQYTHGEVQRTLNETLPDSYVRCGGDNVRPCAVYTLHRMSGNGSDMHPISAFETFEYNPSIANDGRILYTRWDYIDRFNSDFFSLWSARQDGSNPQLVYGNYTVRPQAVMEAQPVPDSNKIIFTASAHHSHNGGSLVLYDPSLENEGASPLTRLTPEVPYPETEANLDMYYSSPYPLSEDYFLVAWSHHKLAPHWGSSPVPEPLNPSNALGLYLYDSMGNLELVYRDPKISSMYPMPVRPRKRPPTHNPSGQFDGEPEGNFLVSNIYDGLDGIEPGSIKHIRIVGVAPKTQPHMNQPSLGISKEDPGKFVLGTVPVEEDGSAYFRVPSGVPVFFQALDEENMARQTMRSLTYVQPQETLSCIGCHESRYQALPSGRRPLAILREPSRIKPGPAGSWPLRFNEMIQPVLDSSCVSCHSHKASGSKTAKLDLTKNNAYQSLLSFADNDLEKLAFEKARSNVDECAAVNSRLTQVLKEHERKNRVELDRETWDRFITWMDVYAQRNGSFSPEQEQELIDLRIGLSGNVLDE